ncbi:MAG: hypothetical protein ACLQMU_04995 [Methanoregula sp.]|uniref:hypothetical protein n=1 Tax=Methanoregula sp. TaxID=2052170 RepID=UPI003C326E79
MKHPRIFLMLMLAAALIVLACPVQADSGTQAVLYQSTFTADPHWTTNNPSTDYWDPSAEMYHFGIQPSTGNYAYSPSINYNSGSFTLEYDVLLDRVDPGATFRLGFTGDDMDFNKGPNIITAFTTSKDGQIMVLHSVTQSAIQNEVTSAISSYGGQTVTYQLNTTYHVAVNYNNDTGIITETVTNKQTGQQLWSYFTTTQDPLKNMNRIYLGNVGDYGTMGLFAEGWIDNVRLTATIPSASITPTTQPTTPLPTYVITPSTKVTTHVVFTPIPTTTKKSPSSGMVAIVALGIIGACTVAKTMNKKR